MPVIKLTKPAEAVLTAQLIEIEQKKISVQPILSELQAQEIERLRFIEFVIQSSGFRSEDFEIPEVQKTADGMQLNLKPKQKEVK